MLSLKKYGWLCVLGGEVVYAACYLYGSFLSGPAAELHHSIFGLLPGVSWGAVSSFIVGAVDIFVFSWIFAWYMVWMHNKSIIK